MGTALNHLFLLFFLFFSFVMSAPAPAAHPAPRPTDSAFVPTHVACTTVPPPTVYSGFNSNSTSAPASTIHHAPHTTGVASVPTHVTLADVRTETAHNGSNANSTDGTFAAQQLCGVPPDSTPTFFIRQLDNSSVIQQPSTAPSSPPTVDALFMDSGDPLSQRVVVSIIVGFVIFVGCYVSFFCFGGCCCCRRTPVPEPPCPRPGLHGNGLPRLMPSSRVGVLFTIPRPQPVSGRLSVMSGATLTPGIGDSADGGAGKSEYIASGHSAGDEIAMMPRAATHSRPRAPLVESGIFS
ncbi:hypothetical protein K438DRAFT_818179 [Mycena galopus ATCC 62051]|nr:hypothetical protein K438DRAFT_818179 [Mycena galopus ATCC 62051]